MSYKLVHKDILSIKADAIVNAANTKPICTPGAEMDLYQAAGAEQMLEARRLIGEIRYGEAKCTEAFFLKSKYVIHTAIPCQEMDEQEQVSVIRECYKNSLALASELGCRKVAMPIFMLDNYHFPKRKAIDIAMAAVKEFAPKKDMMISLAVSELEEFVLSDALITRIDELLGYNKEIDADEAIDDFVVSETESFAERFFRLVDERGLTDAQVYNRANVNRKIISKLRINPDKNVDKKTALALAVGLELSIEETEDFIKLAGYALSPRIKFDRIVRYFIENGNYDINEINEALFKYTEKVLVGADK
ncbi:MAG: macro domain-containing protein [Butyrivibrio sp.]|uniref:macro domain-containing protein n=1 Tax=Butyrivibrio sp. TaxID=28121 RepID=UPI001B438F63|nr:macro domain-containing protein [Butyrivibrio sp.]MBP3783129.1 macro domain-containing protein [Butyrivibrio sp.]